MGVCYDCYSPGMRTIPHRELRNNSSKVLADVKRGEVIEVTNHGEVVAILIPPQENRLAVMEAAGLITPASSDESFASLPIVAASESAMDVLDDLRGDR